MDKSYKIIGLILSHNCATMIEKTLSRIPIELFHEIIITDDGSTDGSVEEYEKRGYKVFKSSKQGYGANLKNGLKEAFNIGADYVVEIHGDGAQFHPDATYEVVKKINNKPDLILGSRFLEKNKALSLGMPKIRYVANRVLSFIDRIILQRNLSEFHTGYRVYNKTLNPIINKNFSNDYLFSFQIIAAAIANNLVVEEVSVKCEYSGEYTSHGYLGASIYAILHFLVLLHFLCYKYLKLKLGIFRNGWKNKKRNL